MGKTLKSIVDNSDDLFLIKVNKVDKHNPSTWEYKMIDPRWNNPDFKNYKFRTVCLRRGDCFFIAYKSNDSLDYFVDTKKTIYRNSAQKYINSQVRYLVKSNDISITKNEPSFKISELEMKGKHIENFLELCYYFNNYTAIGTGYTRDLRNLIVMDIDVDCTKPDNQQELNNLLLTFASYNTLPDFYIFNKESRHVQLQWLIQNFVYKDIDWKLAEDIASDLSKSQDKNCEIPYKKVEYAKISENGMNYRKFTLALCNIVKNRKKFGDKNYTFWKAKNPMSALMGIYGLELKMPYYENNEVKFLSQDQMFELFSTKEARNKYFNNAPNISEIYEKLGPLMNPLIASLPKNKVEKIVDAEDLSDNKHIKKKKNINMGQSRNTFVLNCTKETTWEILKKYKYRRKEDIKSNEKKIRVEVYNEVKKLFNEEDKKYNGIWPDTTNISTYSDLEFDSTFRSAYMYAISTYKNLTYDEDDRKNSQKSRHFKKSMKLMIVDDIQRKNEKINREELLAEVNKRLSKPLSLGSLKRYISELSKLSDQDRNQLHKDFETELNERKMQLGDAIESNKSQRIINTCKKRYDYLINI